MTMRGPSCVAPTNVRAITLPSPVLTEEQMGNIVGRRLRSLRLTRRHLERCADVLLALARPRLHICEAEAGTEGKDRPGWDRYIQQWQGRSEEHTSELQSLMRISYAVFCLKKKTIKHKRH